MRWSAWSMRRDADDPDGRAEAVWEARGGQYDCDAAQYCGGGAGAGPLPVRIEVTLKPNREVRVPCRCQDAGVVSSCAIKETHAHFHWKIGISAWLERRDCCCATECVPASEDRSRNRRRQNARNNPRVFGNSLRSTTRWRVALEGARTGKSVGGSAPGNGIRRALYARKHFFRHGVSRPGAERRLSDVERMDSRERCKGEIAGDGVDSWRRICCGGLVRAAAGRREAFGKWRSGSFDELPDGHLRIF